MRIEIRQVNNKDKQMIELEKSLKKLKKKLDKEGVFKILRQKKYYIKPSEIRHQKLMKIKHEQKKRKRRGKKQNYCS